MSKRIRCVIPNEEHSDHRIIDDMCFEDTPRPGDSVMTFDGEWFTVVRACHYPSVGDGAASMSLILEPMTRPT